MAERNGDLAPTLQGVGLKKINLASTIGELDAAIEFIFGGTIAPGEKFNGAGLLYALRKKASELLETKNPNRSSLELIEAKKREYEAIEQRLRGYRPGEQLGSNISFHVGGPFIQGAELEDLVNKLPQGAPNRETRMNEKERLEAAQISAEEISRYEG